MNTEWIERLMDQVIALTIEWSTSPQFYAQLAAIVLAVVLSYSLARILSRHAAMLRDEPRPGPMLLFRQKVYQARALLFPLLNILALDENHKDAANLLEEVEHSLVQQNQTGIQTG